MNRPWMKFCPSDWRADPRLRMCSLAARGLWIDIISYMHEGEPYGHLTIDGAIPDLRAIAALVGRPVGEVRKALDELEGRQVCGRSDSGAIISRRMVRDEERSSEGRSEVANRWGQSDGRTRSQRLTQARRKGTHTKEEFQAMVEVFDGRCVRCGSPGDILKDHIIPIYQGGSDALDNLQPLCAPCNRSKGPENVDHRDKALKDWKERLQKRLGYSEKTPREASTQKLEARDQKERKEDAAGAAPTSATKTYVFESGAIHLIQKDFDQWKQAFSHLDLEAELLALSEWAAKQPNWFFAVSSALAKRNRELKLAADRKTNGQLSYNDEYWRGRTPGIV